MHYAAKLLGLVATAAVLVPFAEPPRFSKETGGLMAAALAQSAEVYTTEADRLFQQGIQQFNVSQFREALQSWQQALELYRNPAVQAASTRTSRAREGFVLNNLGIAASNLGEYQQAIDFHQQSLAIAREIGDRHSEGTALGGLGNAYQNLNQYQVAIKLHRQQLVIAREVGNRASEANALGSLGGAYYGLSQYQAAIELHQQQLVIAREVGDRALESSALGGLGNAYSRLGRYQQAVDYFEQVLTIAHESGDRYWERQTLLNLGNAHSGLSQYEQAIGFYQQSLTIARQLGDRGVEGAVLGNLGNAYRSLGQYRQAIAFQEQSLAIAHAAGDRIQAASALSNLGLVYYELGQYQKALDTVEQQLAIFRELSDRYREGITLLNLGNIYLLLDQHQQAAEYLEQSLAISREVGNQPEASKALTGLGNAYRRLGQYQTALSFYQQGLAVSREVGSRQAEGAALLNLGNLYSSLGQYQQAIDFYRQRLAIAHEIGDQQGEGEALNNLGIAYLETNDYASAEAALTQALDVWASLRDSALPDAAKIALFETQRSSFRLLQRALIAQAKKEASLEIAERGRGRAFAEILSQQHSPETAKLNAAPLQLEGIKALARQQQITLVTYSLIRSTDTDYTALYVWVVSPTGDIAFRQQSLEGIELAGLVTASRQAMGVRSDRATIMLEPTPEYIARQQAQTEINLRQLYDLLIAPIADLLPIDPEQPVVFMPQDELFLVPFAALKAADGQYLIEKHTILTAPSIQVLGLATDLPRRRLRLHSGGGGGGSLGSVDGEAGEGSLSEAEGNPLIVGNPTMPTVTFLSESGIFQNVQLNPLPGAQQEAEAISNFLQTPALSGGSATETAVKQRMARADVIHLATHGLLEYGDPRETGTRDLPGAIALGPGNGDDGLLTAAEILAMDLQADLAILSACDTGRGRITGDGVVGLSRAFVAAGVPSIIVSLWAVDDAATADLMVAFYDHWQQSGDKAQALRQAMLITMEQHPDPRLWAAFTLIGSAQ